MATSDFVVKNGLVVNQNLDVKGTTQFTNTVTAVGDLSVQGNTTIGNATVDTFTVNTAALTTSAATFSIANTATTDLSVGGAATTLTIGNAAAAQTISIGNASTGASTYNFGSGATANATTKSLNIGTGGAAGSTTNINIGSTGGGTTTVNSPTTSLVGNVRIGGTDAGPNFIAFRGTTGDQPGNYNHTYIGERIHTAAEASELLIFKGNDPAAISGPDRVRIFAGEFRVDTYTAATGGDTFENVATSANALNRVLVTSNGQITLSASITSTTTTSGTLVVTGGVGVSENIFYGGSLVNSAATLGSNLGDLVSYASFRGSNGNANYLDILMLRGAAGSNWTTAATRIQQRIDSTYMAYMEFNGPNANGGIEWGSGTTTASPQAITTRMRLDSSGSLRLLANTGSTSATSGTLIVTGGVGISENLYVGGNSYITNTGPVLVLRDTDSTGVNQIGYLSFQDNGSVERAWVGYGTTANDTFNIQNNYSGGFTFNGNTVWHAGNDGSSSGLDADLLDGINSTGFVLRDEVKSFGTIAIQAVVGSSVSCTTAQFISHLETLGFFDHVHSYAKCSWDYAGNNDISDTGFGGNFETAGCVIETWTDNSDDTTRGNITVRITAPTTGGNAGGKILIYNDQGVGYSPGWRQVWTNTTDGSGSGLDADLLDGLNADTAANGSTIVSRDANADFSGRYINASYFNSSDDSSGVTISSITAKFGDNYHRSATAAKVATFISGQTMNIAGSSTTAGSTTTVTTGGSVTTTVLSSGGSTTPGSVTGTWTLTTGSTWQATFADLAEWYDSDVDYEPSTVVVFGGEKEITVSTIANDTRVAGVISTNPAFIMNVDQPGPSACVALQGKVPVKVIGQIAKGDLLVTSSIPGVAMVNNSAAPYTVIGKSLENKTTEDQGVVYVSVGR